MEWTKVSKEVIDKVPEIILLKKGELQVKYAEALVKIDKVLQIIKECKKYGFKYIKGVLHIAGSTENNNINAKGQEGANKCFYNKIQNSVQRDNSAY